ncbi:TauD/TfdA dioxygenase family protein [Desertibaculum subflavum]|uniref:TauD/TfdA dioxygenase family protein n=1 Tax=Desertibaculum subflavum TaxID=2268458 RepID=UPI000E66F1A5
MVTVTPIHADFVAEIGGVDISRPLAPAEWQAVEQAFDRYAVLVFHGQKLTEAQQLAFAERFGPLERSIGTYVYGVGKRRRLERPELSDISNLDEDGAVIARDDERRLINISNQLWHTDSSFKKTPAKMSMLSAQEVPPEGGETEFADMRAVWDALPAARQRALEGLVAEHDYYYSRSLTGFDASTIPPERRALTPPVPQVLVRTHPVTGRKSLYLAAHIKRIYGMDEVASRALIDELMALATEPRFVHQHKWKADDVVMWDNRCTMHRGRPFDERSRRSMRRATVSDIGPTVAADWRPPA